MRNLIGVIKAIKTQVPDDFEKRDKLFEKLDYIAESVPYTPDEGLALRFQDTSLVLQKYLGDPDTDWKKSIVDIFADKVDYQIYLVGDPVNEEDA